MQKLQYDDLSQQLADWASICSSSEIHGLVSGLGSVALAGKEELVKDIVLRHIEETDCPEHIAAVIQEIRVAVVGEFEDPEFVFAPLLPDDDEELSLRILALAQWCQGFLVGFGTGVKTEQVNFSEEAQEVLRDLVEISNIADELGEAVTEEDEVAYTELEEYVRAASMVLYSEFGLSQTSPPSEGKDSDAANTEPKPEIYH